MKKSRIRGRGKAAILAVFLLVAIICPAKAVLEDIDIDSDTTIGASEEYGTVNIYDSPPEQTSVTMTGGSINYCNLYDTAILLYKNGRIGTFYLYDGSTVIVSASPADRFDVYNSSQAHIYNGESLINVRIYDDAELHVYGYSLELIMPTSPGTSGGVTGYWESGESFTIGFRNAGNFNPSTQVFLNEIPEPATILLFSIIGIFFRKTRKQSCL